MKKDYKEERNQAYQLFLEGKKYKEIADTVGVTLSAVKSWASRYWNNEKVATKEDEKVATKKKRGGQPGNKNATGPAPRNQNARKHGFFSKWIPEEIIEIIGEMPENRLDVLWDNIQLQYASIIRAQKIMYVKDQQDMTKEVSLDGEATAYNIQFAWDKQSNFMTAQSRAMKTLESMIKQYDEMLHKNWDLATEEQKARLGLLKAQKNKLESDGGESEQLDKLDKLISGIDEVAKL